MLGFVAYSSYIAGLSIPRNISDGTGVCTSRSERFGYVLAIARHRKPKISWTFAGWQQFGVAGAAWWSEREANEDVA